MHNVCFVNTTISGVILAVRWLSRWRPVCAGGHIGSKMAFALAVGLRWSHIGSKMAFALAVGLLALESYWQ